MLYYNIKPFTCNIASGRHIFIALLNIITLSLFAFAPTDPGWILHPVLIHHSFLLCLSLDRSFFFWGACRPNSVSLMFLCRATWPPFMFLIMHDLHQASFVSDPCTVFLYTTTSLGPLITGLCFHSTPELRRAKPDEIEPTKAYQREAWGPCTIQHRNKAPHPDLSCWESILTSKEIQSTLESPLSHTEVKESVDFLLSASFATTMKNQTKVLFKLVTNCLTDLQPNGRKKHTHTQLFHGERGSAHYKPFTIILISV